MEFPRTAHTARQVPIIPLIDILAILLIFFIVSSAPKRKRNVMKLSLPTVENLPTASVSDARVVIAVSREGQVTLDGAPVPAGFLVEYLEIFLEKNPGRKFELEADEGITLDQLLKMWEGLTKVGVPVGEVPTRIKIAGESAEQPSSEESE
jgi:biopolymer transport protein ExbD